MVVLLRRRCTVIRIAAPKGLGDSVYVRACVLHWLSLGQRMAVYTYWPEVFRDLESVRVISPEGVVDFTGFRQVRYVLRDHTTGDQFTMAREAAGIDAPIALRLDWNVWNHALVRSVKRQANGRPILLYQTAKKANNAEQELLRPRPDVFNRFLRKRGAAYFRVRIGHPDHLQENADAQSDLDLVGQTSVGDVFDLGMIADHFYSESSYLLIMAEAMDKPFTCMLTRRGLRSGYERVHNVKPERIFHKQHLATVIYDES